MIKLIFIVIIAMVAGVAAGESAAGKYTLPSLMVVPSAFAEWSQEEYDLHILKGQTYNEFEYLIYKFNPSNTDITKVMIHYDKALNMLQPRDHDKIAEIYVLKAVAFGSLGYMDEAMSYMDKALDLEYNEESNQTKKNIWNGRSSFSHIDDQYPPNRTFMESPDRVTDHYTCNDYLDAKNYEKAFEIGSYLMEGFEGDYEYSMWEERSIISCKIHALIGLEKWNDVRNHYEKYPIDTMSTIGSEMIISNYHLGNFDESLNLLDFHMTYSLEEGNYGEYNKMVYSMWTAVILEQQWKQQEADYLFSNLAKQSESRFYKYFGESIDVDINILKANAYTSIYDYENAKKQLDSMPDTAETVPLKIQNEYNLKENNDKIYIITEDTSYFFYMTIGFIVGAIVLFLVIRFILYYFLT